MPQIQVAAFGAALTANGDVGTKGTVTVASTAGVYPGMKGYLSSSTLNQFVMVTAVVSAIVLAIRFLPEGLDDPKLQSGAVRRHNYGNDACSGFTTAQTARIDLPQQTVEVIQPTFVASAVVPHS